MTVEETMADERRLPRCLECGAAMHWARRKRDGVAFVSCRRYPKCSGSLSTAQLARMLAKRCTSVAIGERRATTLRKRSAT